MDSDEIRARLAAAIPDGNIYWTDEDQADKLLPVVRALMADERAAIVATLRRQAERYRDINPLQCSTLYNTAHDVEDGVDRVSGGSRTF